MERAPLEEDGGKKERRRGGEMTLPNIGNPDGYQKKGVAGEAKRMVVKRKGLAKLAGHLGWVLAATLRSEQEWGRKFRMERRKT